MTEKILNRISNKEKNHNRLFMNVMVELQLELRYGVYYHFQQYFSYIVVLSFIGGENHRPAASH
jgi:hypothetical protein